MLVFSLTTKKKRLRDYFIKTKARRHFYIYTFPREDRISHESETNDMDS